MLRHAPVRQKGLLASNSCASFARDLWIDLDPFPAGSVALRGDCRIETATRRQGWPPAGCVDREQNWPRGIHMEAR